jgi:hypothetical protein
MQIPAVVLQSSCSRPAVVLQSSCSRPVIVLQSSCSRLPVVLQSSCSRLAVVLQSSCSRPAVVLQSSCSHVLVVCKNGGHQKGHHVLELKTEVDQGVTAVKYPRVFTLLQFEIWNLIYTAVTAQKQNSL